MCNMVQINIIRFKEFQAWVCDIAGTQEKSSSLYWDQEIQENFPVVGMPKEK